MVWPGMGSEVVFELWKKVSGDYYIRVLWKGQPMKTSTPLGTLNMVPVQKFLDVSVLDLWESWLELISISISVR